MDVPTGASEVAPRPNLVVLDAGVRVWADGKLAGGGSPWRLSRMPDQVAGLLSRLEAAYPEPAPTDESEQAAVSALVNRGLAHPVPECGHDHSSEVTVVVAAFGRSELLRRCLASLSGVNVLVVDDATPEPSPVRLVAAELGCGYHRLDTNSGPGAARNAGARLAQTAFVAFVDSDCEVTANWLAPVLAHFHDPRVVAVAPRVVAADGDSVLERFEAAESALDMGATPAIARPGGRLGYVPSAALVVRREVVLAQSFAEELRVGEDVDLVWRMADCGGLVRFEPRSVVRHESRAGLREWVAQRYGYGTSAVELERRHPGRLTPLRISAWNAAAIGLAVAGRPRLAAAAAAAGTARTMVALREQGIGARVGLTLAGTQLLHDADSAGRVLRREYWPLGAVALVATPRSPAARRVAALLLAPVMTEWERERPALDPIRYVGLRLAADAGYGAGVLRGALAARDFAALRPRFTSGARRPGSGGSAEM